MIPIGYMAKRIRARPESYWLFDSPQIMVELAQRDSIDLTGTRLFFYEAHELEFDDSASTWALFHPEPSFETRVIPPSQKSLEGYDVVTFSARTSPECSPLSCCSLAAEVETNSHCLLPSFERAKQLLEEGRFRNTEPGPHRVIAVYSTEWP